MPEYSAGALTGVVTDSLGHVVTDFVHMAPGSYHIDVTATNPLCVTSFPPGTPDGGTGLPTCIDFDPATVGHDFTVSCPGTNNFTFTGPPLDTWTGLVTFILGGGINFKVPNPVGACACNSPGQPCCQVRMDYDATVTTASGYTATWSWVGGLYTFSATPGTTGTTTISLVHYPFLLLPSDGFGATTITGNIKYVSRATGGACPLPSVTISQDFTLDLCNGLSQTVATVPGPCS